MEHSPQMHGVLLGMVVIAAVVGGLVYLVWSRLVKGRRRSDDRASDQSPEG
jgi:uncharacterized protein (DUF2062 family)